MPVWVFIRSDTGSVSKKKAAFIRMPVRYSTNFLRKFLRFSYEGDNDILKTVRSPARIYKKLKKNYFMQQSTGSLCYNKKHKDFT